MADRLTLALPTDVFLDHFDSTVTQTQLDNNTTLGSPDDRDMLTSQLEGAEDEFRQLTDTDMRLARAGTPGQRETYEQLTHKVKGHQAFKTSFSRAGRDYAATEMTVSLQNGRVLPFDVEAGDQCYVYRGTRRTGTDQWEDITADRGETWDIIDHQRGTVVIHPIKLQRAAARATHGIGVGSRRLREVRLAISYRYGALGGSRGAAASTTLTEQLTEEGPDRVGIDDAGRLPVGLGGGSIVLLIGGEYVSASVDVDADELVIAERGIRNTDPASHDAEARVQYTPPAVRKAVAARAGMSIIQSGRYQSFLPDADDVIDKSDMLDQLRETWERTLEAMS